MISIHKIRDYTIQGRVYGVDALCVGQKNRAQKIFHVLDYINCDPKWYIGKSVICKRDFGDTVFMLESDEVTNIGNFKGQKENPMKVFEL